MSKQAWLQLYQCCLLALKEAYIPCAGQMVPRASSSGRGDSNEVAELKHQLAAAQDQLRDSQGAVGLEREMVRVTRV